MIVSTKLIHMLMLNRRNDRANSQPSRNHAKLDPQRQIAMKFPPIWAIIALSLAGLEQLEIAQAEPLNSASQQLSERGSSLRSIVQNSPTSTPSKPTIKECSKLTNDTKSPAVVGITSVKRITLQEALDIAARNNREVQAACLAIDRSISDVREAEAAKNIQVGLNSTLRAQGAPVFTERTLNQSGNLTTDVQGAVEATYSLIDRNLDKRIRSSKTQVEISRLDLQQIERRLKGDVITAYYSLQQSDSASIINEAAIKDATRSLSDAQLQEKAGVGTKFDILRAQVQLTTAKQALTTSQGQQRTARRKIAQLLSFDSNTEFQSDGNVSKLGTWNQSLEDSILIAFKNRAELKKQVLQRDITSFQDEIRGDDSARVNLFANYNLGKTISTNSPAQDGYSVGARLSWNFWDGGGSAARSDRQKITDNVSDSQLITARNQVRFEVEEAFSSLSTNTQKIETSTQALRQAEESLKLARLRFQAGVGTQTDVIQAQTALATSRGDRVTAILDYNRALSILRNATEQVA